MHAWVVVCRREKCIGKPTLKWPTEFFFLRILIGQPASRKRLKVAHIADVEFDPARGHLVNTVHLIYSAIYGRTDIRKTSCNDKNMDRQEHSN